MRNTFRLGLYKRLLSISPRYSTLSSAGDGDSGENSLKTALDYSNSILQIAAACTFLTLAYNYRDENDKKSKTENDEIQLKVLDLVKKLEEKEDVKRDEEFKKAKKNFWKNKIKLEKESIQLQKDKFEFEKQIREKAEQEIYTLKTRHQDDLYNLDFAHKKKTEEINREH